MGDVRVLHGDSREAAYVADIERRIAWARGQGGLTKAEIKQPPPERMGGLFEGLE